MGAISVQDEEQDQLVTVAASSGAEPCTNAALVPLTWATRGATMGTVLN